MNNGLSFLFQVSNNLKLFFFLLFFLELQIAEGILPHRSALGFPGLAGGFTFTIYG